MGIHTQLANQENMKSSTEPNTSLTDGITLIIYNFLDMISLSLDRTIY